jgi:hypothetical protein
VCAAGCIHAPNGWDLWESTFYSPSIESEGVNQYLKIAPDGGDLRPRMSHHVSVPGNYYVSMDFSGGFNTGNNGEFALIRITHGYDPNQEIIAEVAQLGSQGGFSFYSYLQNQTCGWVQKDYGPRVSDGWDHLTLTVHRNGQYFVQISNNEGILFQENELFPCSPEEPNDIAVGSFSPNDDGGGAAWDNIHVNACGTGDPC